MNGFFFSERKQQIFQRGVLKLGGTPIAKTLVRFARVQAKITASSLFDNSKHINGTKTTKRDLGVRENGFYSTEFT